MVKGQSIVIKGDISGNEDLVIAGRVEGSITLDGRLLTLAEGSQVSGTVSAASVVLRRYPARVKYFSASRVSRDGSAAFM